MCCLINTTDEIIANYLKFKWNYNKPSDFFSSIKEHMEMREKSTSKNQTLSIHSGRKPIRIDEDDSIPELRINYEESETSLIVPQRSNFTIQNSTSLLKADRPTSEVQKRYKIRKPEDLTSRKH